MPAVLWFRRAPSDHPYAELAEVVADRFDVRFCDWDEAPNGTKHARSLPIGRRRAGREAVSITLPRGAAIRQLLTARERLVVVKEVGLLTALAGCGRLIRPHRRIVCLVQHHPRHGGAAVHARWKRPFRRLLGAGVHRFIANTEDAAAWLRDEVGVRPDRIRQGWWLAGLPPGLETTPLPLVDTLPQTPPPIRLVFVGALSERKRPGLIVDVVAQLRAQGLDAGATVIGDGPLRAELTQRAETGGIAAHVELTGRLSRVEVADHLRRADLLLLPSIEELLGRVVVEALSCGTPAMIAGGVGSAGVLVHDGLNGLVVDSDDPAVWTARIAALTPAHWHHLRTGARNSARGLTAAACVAPIADALDDLART